MIKSILVSTFFFVALLCLKGFGFSPIFCPNSFVPLDTFRFIDGSAKSTFIIRPDVRRYLQHNNSILMVATWQSGT
jgi:hypothetical protein